MHLLSSSWPIGRATMGPHDGEPSSSRPWTAPPSRRTRTRRWRTTWRRCRRSPWTSRPPRRRTCAVVLRIHHALGDGTSLVSLLRRARGAPPTPGPRALPAMPAPPPPPRRRLRRPAAARVVGGSPGARCVGAGVRAPCSRGTPWWTWRASSPYGAAAGARPAQAPTVFAGVEFRRKRFVMRTLSLDDVKLVKHALGCVSRRRSNTTMHHACTFFSSTVLYIRAV